MESNMCLGNTQLGSKWYTQNYAEDLESRHPNDNTGLSKVLYHKNNTLKAGVIV